MKKNIIAWDLGGTKCAAGLIEYDEATQDFVCRKRYSVELADTISLDDLTQQVETGLDASMRDVDAICVGAAGHYNGEELVYEGPYPYPMTFAQIAKSQQWPAFAVIHDYAPIVCSTFTSYLHTQDNVKYLNSCPINPHGRRVALGIGTGLGLKDGVLFSNGDFWLGQNEIGHIGISKPPKAEKEELARHQELLKFLHLHQPITFEKILSGPGLTLLYQFFYPQREILSPKQIGIQMRNGEANEMMEAFAWYLGLFIGTVQLTFMPDGGIWITGGVALKNLDIFDHPHFLRGIHVSPAYLAQREQYPLGVLCNRDHALIGGGYYAVKRLLK